MAKPKVYIFDWKQKQVYENLKDLANIKVSINYPYNLENLFLAVFHGGIFVDDDKVAYDFLRKLQERKIPIIFDCIELNNSWKSVFDIRGIDYSQIMCTPDDDGNVVDKIKSILEKSLINNTK